MKLHLPKLLRHAVLACAAAVTGVTTTVGSATVAGGAVALYLACSQASAAPAIADNVATYTQSTNNKIKPSEIGSAEKVIFNMLSSGNGNWFDGGVLQEFGEDVAIQIGDGTNDALGLCITNGNGDNHTVFKGTLTGSGTISKTGAGKNTTMQFSGNTTGYSGNISLSSSQSFTLIIGGEGVTAAATSSEAGIIGSGSITSAASGGMNSVVKFQYAAANTPVYVTNTYTANGAGTDKLILAGGADFIFTKATTVETLVIETGSATFTDTLTASAAIQNSGALTLNAATVAATIQNSGTVTLNGAVVATSTGGLETIGDSSLGELTNGTHGYRQGTATYKLVNGTGDAASVTLGAGFSLTVDGTTIAADKINNSSGTLSFEFGADSTVYEVLNTCTEAIVYAGNTGEMEKLTGFKLGNGTTLELTTSLAEAVTAGDRIAIDPAAAATIKLTNSGSAVTVLDSSSIVLGEGASLTLDGNGTINLTNTPALRVADTWSGTVAMSVGNGSLNLTYLNGLATANSTLQLTGVSGYLSAGTAAGATVSADLQLFNSADGYAICLCNGSSDSDQAAVFSGAIEGDGNITYTWATGTTARTTYEFSGDISQWDGKFIRNIANDAGKVLEVKFTSGGEVFKINGNGGVKDAGSTAKTHVIIDSGSDTNFNGSIEKAASLAVNSNTVFKKDISVAGAMTVADGATATIGTGVEAELASLEGTLTVNGGTLTLNKVATGKSAGIAGSGATITQTITNNGSLDITAGSITVNDDLNAYTVKSAGTTTYSLGGENGFKQTEGGSYYLVKGNGVTVSVAQVNIGDSTSDLKCDNSGAWFKSNKAVSGTEFYASSGEVTADAAAVAKATSFVLKGGTLVITEGAVDSSKVDTTAMGSGGVKLESKATLTGLTTANHAALIGATTGSGTIEVAVANDWNTTIATHATFAGTVYVNGGSKFTYDSNGLGNTLKLAEGVSMQVNGGGSLTDALVLETGNHEVHVNGGTTFEITGKISGEGVFDKRGGNSTSYIKEGASVSNYKNTAGTTTVEAGSVNNFTLADGTANINGGNVSKMGVDAGTAHINGGTISHLTLTGGTLNGKGGTIQTLDFNGGTFNSTKASGETASAIAIGTLNVAGVEGGLTITGTAGEAKVDKLVLQDDATLNVEGSLTLGTLQFGANSLLNAATLAGPETILELGDLLEGAGEMTEKATLLTLTNASDCLLKYDSKMVGTNEAAVSIEHTATNGTVHSYKLSWDKTSLVLTHEGSEAPPSSWDTNNHVWAEGAQFDAYGNAYEEGQRVIFDTMDVVEEVQVYGDLAVGHINVNVGEGSYTFVQHEEGGSLDAEGLMVTSGTVDFQVGDIGISGKVENSATLKTEGALSVEESVVNKGTMEVGGALEADTVTNAGALKVGVLQGKLSQTQAGASLEITTESTVKEAEIAGESTLIANDTSWNLQDASLGAGVVIQTSGDTVINVSDSTLAGAINTEGGQLTLSGTISISADFKDKEITISGYSEGDNGYAQAAEKFQIATAGASAAEDTQWVVLENTRGRAASNDTEAEYDAATGTLLVTGVETTPEYWINSGEVIYDRTNILYNRASVLKLRAGKLVLNSSLRSSLRDGIQLQGDATELQLGSNVSGDVDVSGAYRVNITGGNEKTNLVLRDGVTAHLDDVQGITISAEPTDITLEGKLSNGALTVAAGSVISGDLDMDNTSVLNVVWDKQDSVLTAAEIASANTTGIVRLGQISNIDTVVMEGSDVCEKYFASWTLKKNANGENAVIASGRNTSYYTDKAGDSLSASGEAGLAMADAALVKYNPQASAPGSDMAAILTLLDSASASYADEIGAGIAGASTAVLGMAALGDVDRQLQAIRNRTTSMGVDHSLAQNDMPYFNAWINAEGDHAELSKNGTESGYELSSWGGTVGFDADFSPSFTAGLALTAMYGDLDTTCEDKASGNMDSYYVTAFARYAPSAWTHTFVGTIGMSDISLDRHLAGARIKGETEGTSFGLMYEVGRVFSLNEDGTTCLQPIFNVSWKHTTVDAYTEEGSDLALEVDEQTLDTVTVGLGARMQTVVGSSVFNRTSILEARALAKLDTGDRSSSAEVAMSALEGSSAEVDSAEMGAFGLEIGAGLTIPLGGKDGSIFMDAAVELRSDYTNVNGTVGYRVNF